MGILTLAQIFVVTFAILVARLNAASWPQALLVAFGAWISVLLSLVILESAGIV